MHGGRALGERLDEIADDLRTGLVDQINREGMRKGWHAQLTALTSTARGRAAARGLGVRVSTLVSWLSESTTPRTSHREAIERAYLADRKVGRQRQLRAEAERRLADEMRAKLTNPPRGTQVEIYTENDPGTPHRTPTLDPDEWDEILDAYEEDDGDGLEDIWEGIVDDLDTSGNEADLMINYVSSLGF